MKNHLPASITITSRQVSSRPCSWHPRLKLALLPICISALPVLGWAHESFLPLHEHNPGGHSHATDDPAHSHRIGDGKEAIGVHEQHHAHRWAVAAGARYTRYSLEGRASLWETGLGIDFAALPWLHIGGDFSYGWFDSKLGDADGWLNPHAHVDVHIPFARDWELLAGFEVGFPGGDEALVGEHWELVPHVELHHDRGAWYARAGAQFVFVTGDSHGAHDHARELEDEGEGHHDHGHEDHDHSHEPEETTRSTDFHHIVDPHGDRELRYYAAFGTRVFDQRLTLEARFSGVHVASGDTPERNYARAGLLTSWKLNERASVTTEASVPITDAKRNDWQGSFGLRFEF